MSEQLIDRLADLEKLKRMPRDELRWLVENGKFGTCEIGTVIVFKGKPVDHMWILLSGKVVIRVDRGAGPKLVTEWLSGDVTGMLPYSRMTSPPGDNYVEEKAEFISIHIDQFPEMINRCPVFTAYTVHSMIDRARKFNSSDLQDEKMLSLGRLSAGLAHELNNPASASVRNAKLLRDGIADLDTASRRLGTLRLSRDQLTALAEMLAACLKTSHNSSMSPIEKADHQDQISSWLGQYKIDPLLELPLSDTGITISQLQDLARIIPGEALDAVLFWLSASWLTHSLTEEIEQATSRIHHVIDAVKKFTYMDNLGIEELVEIEPGIRSTIDVLSAKSIEKNASVTLDTDAQIPDIYANGSDLNQVWFSLLDNALDAIPECGTIRIRAASEGDHITVRIIDDGPGIPADKISKIFDPFYTTKPPGQGTGLGLVIARRLICRNQGDILVSSHPGRTEFCITLPAKNRNQKL